MLVNLYSAQEAIALGIPSSAYVHIPFCRRRCYYCDFPISVVGERLHGDSSGTISQYVEALCQEIAITPALGQPLKTVFFGGGTPSLLSINQLNHILDALNQRFGISADAEISMEMDPGTFSLEQLQGYRAAGVNRVSLGVQAFQPELLQVCGRSHTVADIWAAVEIVRQVGVPNFSLDLISGLPRQTLEQWQESLEAAVAIAPTHISIYDLTIEPGTAFGRYYQPGVQPLPTDDTTVQMYRQARQVLITTAGYEHYEISNYAQPGHQCRHNRVYWENRSYYGFGMGATSYVEEKRFTRPRKTKEYYQWVQNLIAVGGLLDHPQTLPDEVLLETLMLGLRLKEGVSILTLTQQFGEATLGKIWQCLQPYHRQGWVEILGTEEKATFVPNASYIPTSGQLRLTDPEGFLFSNVVLAALFGRLS
ncbi:radical SAM family heme chaperone HemW [Chroococcidiopsis sp. CCMEE 29]|uniref:radical SAM family heme chaperone HemW n=1 Tax=Chroococcidiopsis sp. CCMEE 29 TaxID=155894 RepID=UPI002022987B|nr:radical SAM family heme chaperone HemW [Chroococcidiopsis sp. CCMEE 29]